PCRRCHDGAFERQPPHTLTYSPQTQTVSTATAHLPERRKAPRWRLGRAPWAADAALQTPPRRWEPTRIGKHRAHLPVSIGTCRYGPGPESPGRRQRLRARPEGGTATTRLLTRRSARHEATRPARYNTGKTSSWAAPQTPDATLGEKNQREID